MEVIHGHFKDRMMYDSAAKSAISIRDGYLEYAGAEIGKEPSAKIFKVFRSPATIANVANVMKGIPLTDDHVDLNSEVENPLGSVKSAMMIDFDDESTQSKLAIKNIIDVDGSAQNVLNSGKRELSLGYTGTLIEYEGDEYDYEQRDIMPHHLAIVDQGRCGSQCSFIDKKHKEKDMKNKYMELFLDANGAPNMQEIVDMTVALPEAIKSMPIDELKKLAPKLQAIIANSGMGSEMEGMEKEMDAEATDEDMAEKEDMEAKDEGDKEKYKDKEKMEAKDEDKEGEKMAVKDTAEFKDAVKQAVDERVNAHTDVIMKAIDFVDENYDFKGKDTNQIMRDALAVSHGSTSFKDSELAVAFKLLKPSSAKYANFADGGNKNKWDDLGNKDY